MPTIVKLLFFALVIALVSANDDTSTQKIKSKVTRTSLHVARSLDPSASELLQVKAKNGEMATLIVKKRTGKNSAVSGTATETTTETSNRNLTGNSEVPAREAKSSLVPLPVEIRSDVVYVKDEAPQQRKKGRQLSTLTIEDGIPVIEGVREPDTPEDKLQTWRNARVINGVLVPHKQTLHSEIPLKSVKKEKENPEKQESSLSSYFETKEKPSMFGEEDAVKAQWKGIADTIPVNMRKTDGKLKPIPVVFADQDKSHAKIVEYINKINQKEVQRRKLGRSISFSDNAEVSRRMDENVDENEEPIWVNTQPQEIWTEEGKISVADRRMDTETGSDFDRNDKFIPIAPVQARLLQPQGVSNYPSSTLYSSQPSRVSFEEGVRTPVLQYAHPELGAQPAKVERQVEDIELTKSRDSSMPSLTYFLNDPYADRSPYAYEPGLTSSSDDSLSSNTNTELSNSIGGAHERENLRRQSVRNIEFTTSIAESSSINPDEIDITEPPGRAKGGSYFSDSYSPNHDNYLQSYQHFSYPGKYSMTKEDYYKWKMSGMSYGNSHTPTGYYIRIPDNRPFWEKITDTIKETVQSGVESMKEITRPVMEPLVEATQRISENLGIPEATAKISNTLGLNHGTGMRTALQEKIGAAASSSPVLLPALGLVGAGAALGLGAVAVGRLLDVNVPLLKRSGGDGEDAQFFIQQRALNAVNDVKNATFINDDSTPQRSAKFLPFQKKIGEKESKNEFKRLIDESGIEELEKFHFDLNENSEENKSRRRSLMSKKEDQDANEDYLIRLQKSGIDDLDTFAAKLNGLELPSAWRNVPCAQKIFCEALVNEPMEKADRVADRLTPADKNSTPSFVRPVLTAAKHRDCSPFVCHGTIYR